MKTSKQAFSLTNGDVIKKNEIFYVVKNVFSTGEGKCGVLTTVLGGAEHGRTFYFGKATTVKTYSPLLSTQPQHTLGKLQLSSFTDTELNVVGAGRLYIGDKTIANYQANKKNGTTIKEAEANANRFLEAWNTLEQNKRNWNCSRRIKGN